MNATEEFIFLSLIYAYRATTLGIVKKDYYQDTADHIYWEWVFLNEEIEEEMFLKLINFIENSKEESLELLKELRKDTKNCYPYTKEWDLKL
ncbi:hypothetical protein [Viridibacillus arvi]|uniref:hypothetical protein n=1 Tax=Viridibacillus arvi TaxID=263475 RepID=UPI0034CFA206